MIFQDQPRQSRVTVTDAEQRDPPEKMARLPQWCADITAASRAGGEPDYRFVYVDQKGFEAYPPGYFAGLIQMFRDYQN
ncbi:MAG: hypothetical protein ACREYF_04445 [Gammaproteobacteria bacterium]